MRRMFGGMIRAGFVVAVVALASTASAANGPGRGRACQDTQFAGRAVPMVVANIEEGLKRGINDDVFAMRVYFGRARGIVRWGAAPCKPALVKQYWAMAASLNAYQRGVEQVISKDPKGVPTIRAATRKLTAVALALGYRIGPVLNPLVAKL